MIFYVIYDIICVFCGVVMNLLRIIKSLFRRKSNNNTDITLNSDCIREYNKLTAKDKIKVAKEIEKIVNFDFSDIISYTNNEDSKFNYIQDYLINSKRKPDDVSEDPIVNNARKINSLLIYAGECEIIKKELQEIKTELEIKYHALDSIITKPSSMLKNKKEKLWFIKLRDNLIEARRKISLTIANVSFIIVSSNNRIISSKIDIQKEIQYQDYTINNELYQKTLDVLVETITDYSRYGDDFLDLNKELLAKIQEFLKKNTRIKSRVMPYYEDCFFKNVWRPEKCTPSAYFNYFEQYDKDAWRYLFNELPDNLIKELYKILAKYIHKFNIKAYDHRNDYKIYLKEVEDLTNKYLNTPTASWRSNGFYVFSSMLQFSTDGCNYSNMCKAYLTDEIRQQMRTAFARLNWLFVIAGGNGHYACHSWKYLEEDDARILANETHEYYDQFSEELLKKVEEKFGVNLSELKFLTRNENYRVKFGLNRRELVNLLNDVYYRTLCVHPTKEHPIVCRHKNTNTIITGLNICGYRASTEDLDLEDLYYYLRVKHSGNPKIDFSEAISPIEIENFVALIQFKQFEKQYDDRILIIPDIMKNDKLWDHIKFHRTNSIAVLATNYNMFDDFLCSSGIRSTAKYLFVKENTIISYRDAIEECFPIYYDFVEQLNNNGHAPTNGQILAAINRVNIWNNYFERRDKYIDYPDLKIIIVPDDTSYSELSDILNQELAKTEEAKRNVYINE